MIIIRWQINITHTKKCILDVHRPLLGKASQRVASISSILEKERSWDSAPVNSWTFVNMCLGLWLYSVSFSYFLPSTLVNLLLFSLVFLASWVCYFLFFFVFTFLMSPVSAHCQLQFLMLFPGYPRVFGSQCSPPPIFPLKTGSFCSPFIKSLLFLHFLHLGPASSPQLTEKTKEKQILISYQVNSPTDEEAQHKATSLRFFSVKHAGLGRRQG